MPIRAARGQTRIIGENGLRPDGDRVYFGTIPVDQTCGRRTRQWRPNTRAGRNAVVGTHCHLHRDERTLARHHREERCIQRSRVGVENAGGDGDASLAENVEPVSVDERVRVAGGNNHPGDAGIRHNGGTGGSPSDMAARLQRAVQRRATRPRAGITQRVHFRMRSAGGLVEAAPDDDSLAIDHDGSHHRIGTGAAASPLSQRKRASHVIGVS